MQPEITESPQGTVAPGAEVVVRGQLGVDGEVAHEVTVDGEAVAHRWHRDGSTFAIAFTVPETASDGRIVLVSVRDAHGEDTKAIPVAGR